MTGSVLVNGFKEKPMKHPVQFRKLKSVLKSRAVQGIAADSLRDISTACIFAAGYLLLFAQDNSHAHRLFWVIVLGVDAVVACICSVDLAGDQA